MLCLRDGRFKGNVVSSFLNDGDWKEGIEVVQAVKQLIKPTWLNIKKHAEKLITSQTSSLNEHLTVMSSWDGSSGEKMFSELKNPNKKENLTVALIRRLRLPQAGDAFWKEFGAAGGRSSSLRYPVRRHAGVVLAVTPGGPDEEGGGHHLQRDGDEGEVEGPAQRDLHPLRPREGLVEQIQAGQEAADCSERAQTC